MKSPNKHTITQLVVNIISPKNTRQTHKCNLWNSLKLPIAYKTILFVLWDKSDNNDKSLNIRFEFSKYGRALMS